MRLDKYLFNIKMFDSTTKAQQAIERGEIYVDGRLMCKSSFSIEENVKHDIKFVANKVFVSLGGYKLDKALTDFDISVENLICADIGCSTGGFTDCLLQNNAKKVFAIDLNNDLLSPKLMQDKKVQFVLKNAKDLYKEDFSEQFDFLCADLSFISATQVLPIFYNLLNDNGICVLLCKPQFEIGAKKKFKNGIIRDEKLRMQALSGVCDCAVNCGFFLKNITVAPLNKDKNIEYLILLSKDNSFSLDFDILYKNIKY